MTVTLNRHAHAAAGGIVQMAQKLWSMLFLKVLSLAVLTSMSVRQHLRHMRTQAAAGRVSIHRVLTRAVVQADTNCTRTDTHASLHLDLIALAGKSVQLALFVMNLRFAKDLSVPRAQSMVNALLECTVMMVLMEFL